MRELIFNNGFSKITPLKERAIKEAYLMLYAYAGAAKEDHFIFTSSGTEAVNHAVWAAYLDITRQTGKNHYLCSALDEAPTILSMSRLHDLGSVFQKIYPSKDGIISAKTFTEMLTPRTAMLSLSWANGLTGVVQPIQEIGSICKERGVLLHLDATHTLCRGDFTFDKCGADILTFSSPTGFGGMFIRSDLEISPLILGGNEQGGRRGGPFSWNALIEMAQWAKKERSLEDHYTMEIARMRALFEERLSSQIPELEVLLANQFRVPHLSTLIFPGVASESLKFLLAQNDLVSSNGGGNFQTLYHIGRACGLEEEEAHSALNFSFSSDTTEDEIERGVEKVVESVTVLRKYSHYLNTHEEKCLTTS